jgi:hypothetical protein
MSTVLSPTFANLSVEHVVPDSADVSKSLSASDVLVGRRVVRFQAQTGVKVGDVGTNGSAGGTSAAGAVVQFLLADGTGMLDPASLRLTGTMRCKSASSSTTAVSVAFEEGLPIRRISISQNGQLVDDVDFCQATANAQIYASANSSWYSSTGSFANMYMLNPAMNSPVAGTGSAYVSNIAATSVPGTTNTTSAGSITLGAYAPVFGDAVSAQQNANRRHTGGATATSGGMEFGLALGALSGYFRGTTLMPLFAMGETLIQLTLAQNSEALWQWSGTDGIYELSDLFLEAEICSPHSTYMNLINKLTQDDGEQGLTMSYESTIVSSGVAVTGSSGSFIVSRATNNLRKVLYTQSPTASLGNIAYPINSCFPNFQLKDIQIRIGSHYFPSLPSSSLARQWLQTQSCYGEPNNLSQNGILNWYLYGNTTANALTVTNKAGNAVFQLAQNDKFIYAQSFDNVHGANLDIDGISVLGASGSQITLQVNYNATPSESITPRVAMMASRYVVLKNGAITVVGA